MVQSCFAAFVVRPVRWLVPALVAVQCLAAAAALAEGATPPFDVNSKHVLLLDADTGTILFQKAANERMPPASLAKLMTMVVVFDALVSGRLGLDDEFKISENAWRKGGAPSGGSTMFAKLGSSIKVSDLMQGIVVQSANDGCIAIAEGMAGGEDTFAELMNAEARKLRLTGSHFTNATGLPDPAQYVTARDLAKIALHIIHDYPQFYLLYGETQFTWNKILQRNRNPLLAMNIGADGLKTGFTDESGYALIGSAVQNGERLLLVLSGAASDKERADEARRLIGWGFNGFQRVTLFGEGDIVADASVFGGGQSTVALVSKGDVDIFLPRGARDLIKGRVIYQGPVRAPIDKGQPIGKLEISLDGDVLREAPLYAAKNVGVGTLRQRAFDGLQELFLGWL